MDLDAFVTEHQPEWARLQQLARRPKRRLSGAEVDELVSLYQRAATHLSIVRSRSPDPALVARLSRLVQQARMAVTPSSGLRLAEVRRFFVISFPLEVYRSGRWWLAVAAAFSVLTGIRMWLVAGEPERYLHPADIQQLVSYGFEAYYSEHAPQNFALLVWANNALLAGVCLAAGVLIFPVLLMLWINLENIGLVGGVMIAYDRADVFFGLILIHGLLELTAVFVAAGVGLRIGWSWIAPGPYLTRGQALAERARSGMVVALGLAVTLLVSGLVEGFVTPAPIPVPARLAIGALIWLGFLGYVFGCGHLASRDGESADVAAIDRPALAPTG